MDGVDELKARIAELEEQVKDLEKQLEEDGEEKAWVEALYTKAAELVTGQQVTSVIGLQKKLLIDLPRAEKLVRRLKAGGVIVGGQGNW